MKRLMWVVMAGILLAGAGFVDQAEAGKRGRHDRHRYAAPRPAPVRHVDYYFAPRHVHVIRDYYRPYYRPVPPPARYVYRRAGYLPPGWAARVRPIPVHVARGLPAVPYGYSHGIIDGHAVVYNRSGFIFDVAVLF